MGKGKHMLKHFHKSMLSCLGASLQKHAMLGALLCKHSNDLSQSPVVFRSF